MSQKLAVKMGDVPLDLAERHRVVAGRDEVMYVRQGSFTIALIRNKHDDVVSVGVAKRNVMDDNNEEIGCRIAVSRALRHLDALQKLAREAQQ